MPRLSLSSFALSSSLLLLASACDDSGFAADGDPVRFRACPPDCSGGDQNTAVLGLYGVSNMPLHYNENTGNLGAKLNLDSVRVIHNGQPTPVEYMTLSDDGELSMVAAVTGAPVYAGEALIGATFDVVVLPTDSDEPTLTGTIKIKDYTEEDGAKVPGIKVYRYTLTTDIEPQVPGHPQLDGLTDWSLCTYDEETESYDAIIHPFVELDPDNGRIVDSPGHFVFGCLSGAVSKTQYRLNVYYNEVDNGRTMDHDQSNAYINAWRSMIGGVVTTLPGKTVAFQDLALGLVEWTSTQAATWPLEAVYNTSGAACRGVAHRRFLDPSNDIAGWDALPPCTEPYAQWGSVAVRVPPTQLPNP